MPWKWWLLAIPVVALLVFFTHEDLGFWPSLAFFSLAMLAGFYLYGQDSRRLTAVLKPLARRYGGSLSAATILSYPQLRFEAGGRPIAVHFMPNGGANGPPGPFTAVALTLPFDSSIESSAVLSPALVRGAVAALAPDWQATTGDAAFDQAFRLGGKDQAAMAALLDEALRRQLLASSLPKLRVNLRGAEIGIHMDGLAKTTAEIEEMVGLAQEVANRCSQTG